MKKVFFKTMMGAGFAGMLCAGCADDIKDAYDPNYVLERYKANWEAQFGAIDSTQTWNTAKQVTAYVDLTGIASDECEVRIYTANPINPASNLLAVQKMTKFGSFAFDIPQALNYVFVSVMQSEKVLINSYYGIEDGEVTVDKSLTRADGDCPVTVGDKIDMGSFYSSATNTHEPYPGEFYYLNGVTKTTGDSWRYLDFLPLFGKNGIFHEGRNADDTSNRDTYFDQMELGKDLVYVTTEEGPIEISYMFGATQKDNMFGYFYYTDKDKINEAKRYVLMSDAQPTSNIQVTELENGFVANDMSLGDWFLYNTSEENGKTVFAGGNPLVTGSKYKLVYFDEAGNASYDFPQGVNVGFFLLSNGMNINSEMGDVLYYSLPSLNLETGKIKEKKVWNDPDEGDIVAVTYKYGNTKILGFEDKGGDDDMNDLIFFINGEIEYDFEEFPVEEPDAQSWIIACEDLGSTDDFDFNDIVFSVSHVNGATTAEVTPLAAGGTLAANVIFNGSNLGEIHAWLGGNVGSMINTGAGTTGTGASKTVTVGTDFTMTNEMGGFSIQVIKEDGVTTVDVAAPGQGTAPQMICVPGGWAWPSERSNISTAYPDFGVWGSNYNSAVEWYNSPADGYVYR